MLCIPIQPKTTAAAIQQIRKAEKAGDLTELWLDQIRDLDFKMIMENRRKPLLLVNKSVRENGHFRGSEKARLDLLKTGLIHGAEYVDLDIKTRPILIQDLIKSKHRGKIILSYHNFKKTPSETILKQKIDRLFKLGADIAKIAVQINHHNENLRLFNLIKHFHTKHKKIIAIGMGPLGQISRIFGPMLGGYLTYAPLENKSATAPGQLTANALKKNWSILKFNPSKHES